MHSTRFIYYNLLETEDQGGRLYCCEVWDRFLQF